MPHLADRSAVAGQHLPFAGPAHPHRGQQVDRSPTTPTRSSSSTHGARHAGARSSTRPRDGTRRSRGGEMAKHKKPKEEQTTEVTAEESGDGHGESAGPPAKMKGESQKARLSSSLADQPTPRDRPRTPRPSPRSFAPPWASCAWPSLLLLIAALPSRGSSTSVASMACAVGGRRRPCRRRRRPIHLLTSMRVSGTSERQMLASHCGPVSEVRHQPSLRLGAEDDNHDSGHQDAERLEDRRNTPARRVSAGW